MDTCVCMAESLCCPLGTITTLLIGYRPNTGASQVTKVVKNLPASAGDVGDVGLIPASGRSPWRRAWQPTPAFLPGESHGQRSLNGYSPQGHKESDTTEVIQQAHQYKIKSLKDKKKEVVRSLLLFLRPHLPLSIKSILFRPMVSVQGDRGTLEGK